MPAFSLFLLFGFRLEKFIELFDQLVGVDAVYHAGFLHGLHAGDGAVDAVHAGGKENLGGIFVVVHDIADQGFKRNLNRSENPRFRQNRPGSVRTRR